MSKYRDLTDEELAEMIGEGNLSDIDPERLEEAREFVTNFRKILNTLSNMFPEGPENSEFFIGDINDILFNLSEWLEEMELQFLSGEVTERESSLVSITMAHIVGMITIMNTQAKEMTARMREKMMEDGGAGYIDDDDIDEE